MANRIMYGHGRGCRVLWTGHIGVEVVDGMRAVVSRQTVLWTQAKTYPKVPRVKKKT